LTSSQRTVPVLIGEEASARLAAACVVAAYISGGVLYLCGLCEVSKPSANRCTANKRYIC
jgi:1,4-dihydroxy-2-naphthoate octaprenyltransferase